jgi:alpha-beta hydrolase superfamily lysophospholipase
METENRRPANESSICEQISTADGALHFIRSFYAGSPRAVLLYLHGIEGHSLWFERSAKVLQSNDITVLALDRRGSGLSKEARGDLKDYRQLLDDTKEAIKFARSKAGELPLFFMANCWGAKLAAILCEDEALSADLSGLILSSPAIEVKVDLPLIDKLKVAWRLLTGSSTPLAIPLEIADFTDTAEFLEFIENDKLRLKEASARFFLNTAILTSLSKQSAEKISLPTLIVQSGIDNIVDPAGVRKWFDRLNSCDKTFHIFPDAFHSLDFHSHPQDYLDLLMNWIKSRCNGLRTLPAENDSALIQQSRRSS